MESELLSGRYKISLQSHVEWPISFMSYPGFRPLMNGLCTESWCISFSLSSPEISCFHNIGYRTMTVSSWNHDWSHMPYAPTHVCIITRTWMSAYLCMSAWVYTYLFSPHCHVVGVCSHHKHGISEHWTTAPMGNSGLGSCQPLVTLFCLLINTKAYFMCVSV